MKKLLIILNCLFVFSCHSQKQEDAKLIGKWQGILKDSENSNSIEKIVLEFTNDGKFIQFLGEGKFQNVIKSSYKIENDKISAIEEISNEMSESIYFIKNYTLIIKYEGIENKYVKIKK